MGVGEGLATKSCTLTHTAAHPTPKTPRCFPTSAATRLIRDSGRQKGAKERLSAGTQRSERLWEEARTQSRSGGFSRAQLLLLLLPSNSPRRPVSGPAPCLASFQLGPDNRANHVTGALSAPTAPGAGSEGLSQLCKKLAPRSSSSGPSPARWVRPRPAAPPAAAEPTGTEGHAAPARGPQRRPVPGPTFVALQHILVRLHELLLLAAVGRLLTRHVAGHGRPHRVLPEPRGLPVPGPRAEAAAAAAPASALCAYQRLRRRPRSPLSARLARPGSRASLLSPLAPGPLALRRSRLAFPPPHPSAPLLPQPAPARRRRRRRAAAAAPPVRSARPGPFPAPSPRRLRGPASPRPQAAAGWARTAHTGPSGAADPRPARTGTRAEGRERPAHAGVRLGRRPARQNERLGRPNGRETRPGSTGRAGAPVNADLRRRERDKGGSPLAG